MLFRNIMVPYDGSPFSKHAFKIALNMAKKYNSKLTVVTCIGKYYQGFWIYDNRLADLDFKRQYKGAKEEHKKLADIASKSNIEINSTLLQGAKIAEVLAKFAKSEKIDLIVMGSCGRTGLTKALLGSVASGILHLVRCPVLIVK